MADRCSCCYVRCATRLVGVFDEFVARLQRRIVVERRPQLILDFLEHDGRSENDVRLLER